MSAVTIPRVSIIFHGNDIDGWMSAYLITKGIQVQSQFQSQAIFRYYPVSPMKQSAWPSPETIANTYTYIASVAPTQQRLTEYEAVALNIIVVDHHASSAALLSSCKHAVFNTGLCSTALLYSMFFPYLPVPTWVGLVDRLARWQSPTLDDKALREVLHPIACLPLNDSVEVAFEQTDNFLAKLANSGDTVNLIRQGIEILSVKDDTLRNVLRFGQIINLTDENVQTWRLPRSWLGRDVFVLNNTGIIIDSTMASAIVFDENPGVTIFINYRSREIVHPHTGIPVTEYSYSARGRNGSGIDLTEGGVFAGHRCAAGARYLSGENHEIPFIV